MWYLIEEKDPATQSASPSPTYWLGGVSTSGRTIGRKHVDIRLKASSVSRTHAKITVLKAAFYSPSAVTGRRRHQSTSVSVQDSSAYGTFLKYPPGHASNRTESAVGHHRRLDKDTPTEISEGALLAFGAPSAWWRLGWRPVVAMPSRLSAVEKSRLVAIAGLSSLEVVDIWAHDVTHLITSQCVTSSFKFLTAVAEDKHVVTMAWAEAVRHTVGEACRAVTDAASEVAALAACALSDEKLFVPPFCKEDCATFSADELSVVFDPAVRKRRTALFRGVVFSFSREERRGKWAGIVETLGGKTILSKATGAAGRDGRIVFVQGEGGGKRGENGEAGRNAVPEAAVIASIIRADLSSLDCAGMGKMAAAEVTDMATPGPLDESDGDSDDSDPGETVNKQGTRQAFAGEDAEMEVGGGEGAEAAVGIEPVGGGTKKRGRVSSGLDHQSSLLATLSTGKPNSVVAESKECGKGNEDMNCREFFTVEDVAPVVRLDEVRERTGGSGRDVRLFRRRNLPRASEVALKRVRYEGPEGGFVGTEGRQRGIGSSRGARVIERESEDECE